MVWCVLTLVAVFALLAANPGTPAEPAPSAFKILVRDPGVYALTFEDLAGQGLRDSAIPDGDLRLTLGGLPVPLWIESGDDDRFGPGDRAIFIGEPLHGESTYYSEHSELNVYRLTVSSGESDEAEPRNLAEPSGPAAPPHPKFPVGAEVASTRAGEQPTTEKRLAPLTPNPPHLLVREHLERENFLSYFEQAEPDEPREAWLWAMMSHVDPEPFRLQLDLRNREPGAPVSLRLRLRGWTRPRLPGGRASPRDLPDHRVEALVDGQLVGAAEWMGQTVHYLDLEVPPEALGGELMELALRIPKRIPRPEADPVIDVAMLDWIEISYRRGPTVDAGQSRMQIAGPQPPQRIEFVTASDARLEIYTDSGQRLEPDQMDRRAIADRASWRFSAEGETTIVAVIDQAYLRPQSVEADRPSHLLDPSRQADYLIIAHPRLRAAAKPLARHHRSRGLAVELIDVVDIYDELSGGAVDPRAIRDFLDFARRSWQPPAPRYVLLVGDASRNPWGRSPSQGPPERFDPGEMALQAAASSRSSELDPALIPTRRVDALKGAAASDNWLVALGEDGVTPSMAIGRIPAREPAAVEAVVAKTLSYAASAPVGPWRRRLLWIANEGSVYHQRSESVANAFAASGFSARSLLPRLREPIDEHRELMFGELRRGLLLVHFFGHGGRTLWRTGPPAYGKARDLLTLDDLASLPATAPLPIVLSMTCNSAPFDHPSGASLGERLLLEPGRGAVAVIAASWRNGPSLRFSHALVDGLLTDATVGEALQRAKAQARKSSLVDTYHLLGDPALVPARPQLEITLRFDGDTLAGSLPVETFGGRLLLEWLDAEGLVQHQEETELLTPTFSTHLPPHLDRPPASVRAYAWSEAQRIDGIAMLSLTD